MPLIASNVKPPVEVIQLTELASQAAEGPLAWMGEQGTDEWKDARAGVVTGTGAVSVITATGKGADNDKSRGYARKLAGERIDGHSQPTYANGAMKRGIRLEPFARRWYERRKCDVCTVTEVGFIYESKDKRWGCSPDGVRSDRLIEIKCPEYPAMIDILETSIIPKAYIMQMQFGMWVTGLPLCDFIAYSGSKVPNIVIPVEADGVIHGWFDEHVPAFAQQVADKVEWIMKTYGGTPLTSTPDS